MNKAPLHFRLKIQELKKNPPEGFEVLNGGMYKDEGNHPGDFTDFECAWAAGVVHRLDPIRLLDVGSYRHFVYGLAATFDVTAVDLRAKPEMPNMKAIVSDVRDLTLEGVGSFDVIMSLCTIEHIGLGRYGDRPDMDGDKKAMDVLKGLLTVNGSLVFTVPMTAGQPAVLYNAHRTYSYGMVAEMCSGLVLVEETWFSFHTQKETKRLSMTTMKGDFDVYCGHWVKQ